MEKHFFKTTISIKKLEIALKINLSHKILEINGIIIDKKSLICYSKNGDSIEIINSWEADNIKPIYRD